MRWMDKIARCKHVTEVEIQTDWDDNDCHLIRVCQGCGKVSGFNKEIQQWQFLGTMNSFSFALRQSEIVHRKTSGEQLTRIVQKLQSKNRNALVVQDIAPASSDFGQYDSIMKK